MAIFNLGSINIDKTYRVPHLPGPGETLAAASLQVGLGGKGANMSVAAARGAARVIHIGAIGADGRWARDRMLEYGVDTRAIAEVEGETGHAVIAVAEDGENLILLWPGANGQIDEAAIPAVLETISDDDLFVTQNETNAQVCAAEFAKVRGATVLYAAAPFDVDAVQAMLPLTDILVLNEVEAQQLTKVMDVTLSDLPVDQIVITLGGDGCRHINGAEDTHYPAFDVEVVDTTGAGDTFTGFLAAGLDRGQPMAQAIRLAQKAGALMVSRVGTADVIPDLKDIEDSGL
ncbi:ribokinase [Roseobacteraceae bacterium S113]